MTASAVSEATTRPTPPPGATAVPGLTTCRDALHDVVPVVVGYLTLGTAAGTLLVAQGLSWWWAPVWSLVIYSGTMQMVLVPLAATGEPLAAIALSTVFVSGRHVFYGLGFPLQRVRARGGRRAYAVHAITDEVFALLSSKDEGSMSSRYVLTVEAAAQVSWLLGTTAGALVGLLRERPPLTRPLVGRGLRSLRTAMRAGTGIRR